MYGRLVTANPAVDPYSLPLLAWLSAGYVMAVAEADQEARALLDELFTSESEDEMNAAYDDLKTLAAYRKRKAVEAEAKLGDRDKPVFGKRVREAELQAELDFWTNLANGGSEDGEVAEDS